MHPVIHTLRLLQLWLLIGISTGISGQNFRFRYVTPLDGLANGTVLAITQDTLGFMWFGTANGLSRYDTREFKTYRHDPCNPGTISSNYVRSALCDSDGTLWIGTQKGLNRYDSRSDTFEKLFHEPSNEASLSNNTIRCLLQDRRGNLWVGTANGLNLIKITNGKRVITRFSPSLGKTITDLYESADGALWGCSASEVIRIKQKGERFESRSFRLPEFAQPSVGDGIRAIGADSLGNLWLGTQKGRFGKFDPATGKFHPFEGLGAPVNPTFIVNKIGSSSLGKLWIATSEGLFIADPRTEDFQHYHYHAPGEKKLLDNSITTLFEDRQGNFWLGTYTMGTACVEQRAAPFLPLAFDYGGSHINHLLGDPQGNVWLKSDRKGLFRLDKSAGQFVRVPLGSAAAGLSEARFSESGTLWTGDESGTLCEYTDTGKGLREKSRWNIPDTDPSLPKARGIGAILPDSRGRLWVGTYAGGLYCLEKDNSGKIRYTPNARNKLKLGSELITVLLEDSKQNLWIGTLTGVNRLDGKSNRLSWFQTSIEGQESSGIGAINCIREDRNGQVWIGTFYNGLWLFSTEKGTFVKCRDLDLLPDNNIGNILPDDQGFLWLSNDLGLIRYHPGKKTLQQYYFSDGIPGSEIISNSGYKGADGKLFFTTNTGAFCFDPQTITINSRPSKTVFSALKLFNSTVEVNDPTGLLNDNITGAKQITFRHDQSIFTIDFAVLNFIKPDRNRYAYKLKGFEEHWNYVRTPSATYTNLAPGNYTLLARGANNDGVWSTENASLRIVVLPPWWKTWYARLLYLLLLGTVTYFVVRFLWLRSVLRKEADLQRAKLDFFTNISHEIRTRLTLIAGPLEVLTSRKNEDGAVQKQLNVVKSNSDSLLNLVNELLDFRKLESGTTRLQAGPHDLVSFLERILETFQHLSESRNITSVFSANTRPVVLWFDPLHLQKVIYNLLANAYKFAPQGGRVETTVRETDQEVIVTIADNGKGIAARHINKLFNNYYQVYDFGQNNTGYGLGLALSKEIVELHKGTISVTSKEAGTDAEGYTLFKMTFQRGNLHLQPSQIADSMTGEEPEAEHTADAPDNAALAGADDEPAEKNLILLVEDNETLRTAMRETLETHYTILEAPNGLQGRELAIKHIPDLVISDVMMDGMDGITLCKSLKADLRTNHIPVLLLSARAESSHQVEGLDSGADAYLVKPYSMQMLGLQIKNLFRARKILQEKYTRQLNADDGETGFESHDNEFLARIMQFVEENMENNELGIAEISVHLGMSKSTLYRKLKALTRMTINDFVRAIRLKKAATLLKQKQLSVKEVAYRVGFDDRKYFSKLFKKQYGKVPSEYSGSGEEADR